MRDGSVGEIEMRRVAVARAVAVTVALGLAAAACTPRYVHEDPILRNGDRVEEPEAPARAARPVADAVRAEREAHRSEIAADALRECGPETCEALLRGEVALGMSEVEVLAATGTTPEAWFVRDAGPATVMTPVSAVDPPRDAVAGLAMVQLRDGRVARYGYRETRGLRVVDSPEDATLEGRAEGLADLLVREGDEYAAAGDFVRALDRYDRADVLTDDPLVAYKIGAALDKQLRPIEALIQYRLFLHRLELEKIEARGAAAGHLAEAIAQARQRVLILEREAR